MLLLHRSGVCDTLKIIAIMAVLQDSCLDMFFEYRANCRGRDIICDR